ncbi:Transposable element P transposase [Paramuricea clavata]|uniref:Transposable element P transposase n=1 Tax=Paramuricea clavata TaxID=317549 RepID=A0A6S7KFK4_PARCT|nr:Transposable element P transposase [Paramuricea clavata]
MPGENCVFYGYSTSRKHGLSLFKLPSPREDESEETKTLKTNTRQAWFDLTKSTDTSRESTPELRKRIEANNNYLCELHFKHECFSIYPKRKVLVMGSIPTENLPTKSHDMPKIKERHTLIKVDPQNMPCTSSDILPDVPAITSKSSLMKVLL